MRVEFIQTTLYSEGYTECVTTRRNDLGLVTLTGGPAVPWQGPALSMGLLGGDPALTGTEGEHL